MAISKELEQHFQSDSSFQMFATKEEGKISEVSREMFNGASGETFNLSQQIAMGADPNTIISRMKKEVVFISTYAGLRDPETRETVARGAHTGHDKLDYQMLAATKVIDQLGGQARVAYTTGGCDGIWQGRPQMHYSLVSRNTMFQQMSVQLGVYPNMRAAIAFASCDKEGPAATATIAHLIKLEKVYNKKFVGLIIPGGAMLPSEDPEIFDTGKVQAVNAMVNFGKMTPEEANKHLCHACTKTGGGCQFFGTAASQQVVAEALGLILPHGACVPSSTQPWLDIAESSARFAIKLVEEGASISDIISEKSIRNAMVVMSATGASTNMFMHLAFVARAAGLKAPTLDDYKEVFNEVPRFLRVLPNGPAHEDYPRYPKGFPTAMFWTAGGVPEIMLSLKKLGVLELDAGSVTGETLGTNLEQWENSERRTFYRDLLKNEVQVDPNAVIMPIEEGIPASYTFPVGNLCNKSVCKSSSINPDLVKDGIYRKVGNARVFTSEKTLRTAMQERSIQPDDIICLIGRGFYGSGLEEVYEFTAQIAHIPELRNVAILTDARFSGVTTGACIGHVIPEALGGGPCGKLQDGDLVEINIDSNTCMATVNLIGDKESGPVSVEKGNELLAQREQRNDFKANELPDVVKYNASIMHLFNEDWESGYYPDYEKFLEVIKKLELPELSGY